METGHLLMMVKKKIQISKNSVNRESLEEIKLSIQISLDGLSFCTINKGNREVLQLHHIPFTENSGTPHKHLQNVVQVFETEPLLKLPYKEVEVIHLNDLFSIVPKALVNEHNQADYLKYNLKIYKNDFITHDLIGKHDLVNVYSPFVNINNYLIDQFGEFTYTHSATVFLENILDIYKYSEKPHLFALVHENHFDLIAIADNQLQLCNSFSFQNKTDFIYYLLFCAEQLNFNPEYLELILLGNIIKNDARYDIAYKYIRNVTLLENRNNLVLDPGISEDLQRQFFVLLHQNS